MASKRVTPVEAPSEDARHIYMADDGPPAPPAKGIAEVGLYSDGAAGEDVEDSLLGSSNTSQPRKKKPAAAQDWTERRSGGFVEMLPDNCMVASLGVATFVLMVALVLLYATEPTVASTAIHAAKHEHTAPAPPPTPVSDSAPMSPYGKGGDDESSQGKAGLPHSEEKRSALEKYAQAGMKTIVSHDGPSPLTRGIPFPDMQGMEPRPRAVLRDLEGAEAMLINTTLWGGGSCLLVFLLPCLHTHITRGDENAATCPPLLTSVRPVCIYYRTLA